MTLLEGQKPTHVQSGTSGRWHGVDFHVLMTLLFRSWSTFAGATTALIVPLTLTPIQQGYYYTFASILGLQIFFELGLSQVVVQLVGHDVAHLVSANGQLHGDQRRIDRLSSLVQLLRNWYLRASALFAIVGGVTGAVFFHRLGQLPPNDWVLVWVVLALSTAVNLAFVPALALMEGSGQVGQVARLRLAQSAGGYAGVWVVLLSGGNLWAATVLPVASAISTGYWLRNSGKLYAWLSRSSYRKEHRIDWKREVLPFQWRIAASWISGYFIFYAFTPLVFAHQGATEAGRFGIAMTVFTSISAVGMSWMNAKAPQFGMHISRGERASLDALFFGAFKRSSAFTAVAILTVVASVYALSPVLPKFIARIADPAVIICLGIVCGINCIVFSVATYVRAHREEPMLPLSLCVGALTVAAAWYGSAVSLLMMAASYAAINILVTLPWTLMIFRRYVRRTT